MREIALERIRAEDSDQEEHKSSEEIERGRVEQNRIELSQRMMEFLPPQSVDDQDE